MERLIQLHSRQRDHDLIRLGVASCGRSPAIYLHVRRAVRVVSRPIRCCGIDIVQHLICEAENRRALVRGLQGLLIRVAKALNRALQRRGKVFADRYHDRILKTPSEVRNALTYVLNNTRRHAAQFGRKLGRLWVDPCSSARVFFGLDKRGTLPEAKTWLLSAGWKRAGPVRIQDVPGGRAGRR